MKATVTIEPASELPEDDARQFDTGVMWTLEGDGIERTIVSHAATKELALETARNAAAEHGIAKLRVVTP